MIKIEKKGTYLERLDEYCDTRYHFSIDIFLVLLIFTIGALIGEFVYELVVTLLDVLHKGIANTELFYEIFSLSIGNLFVIIMFIVWTIVTNKANVGVLGITVKNVKWVYNWIKGGLLAIFVILIYFAVMNLSGYLVVLDEPYRATNGIGVEAIGLVVLFFFGFVIQGASEEVMIRGWLLPNLTLKYSVITSIIVSSLVFSALHLLNPNISVISILNLFLYGVFACVLAIREHSLWGVFGFHSIWNFFIGNIIGLPVSGLIPGNASIIECSLVGPTIITGGDFGPEGGLFVTAILLVLIVVFGRKLIIKEIGENNEKHI